MIIPSVRYDYSDKFGSEITSRLATTYNAAKDIRVKAVIGQGYKTPTVNELYHFGRCTLLIRVAQDSF